MASANSRDPRPLLIVNADDYGLTPGVSRAILRAHREGIVTSTSVLTLAPGFEESVAWLRDAPGLGTGAHLAVVGEDPPLLTAREIPTLVDKKGALQYSWRQFLPLAAAHRIDPADIKREFAAQIERITQAGLTIDHFDTHQNLHLWPSVRQAVLELGGDHGVRVIRVTRSAAKSVVGVVVGRLARRLERRCDRAGWVYASASTGLDEAGHLDVPNMVTALYRLAATAGPTAELATHPGEAEDPDLARYKWDYQWGDELEALCSPVVRGAVEELGFRLGSFADLEAQSVFRRCCRRHEDVEVRGPSSPNASRAVGAFADAPRGDRFHVRGRWWTAPFPAVESRLPMSGRVLEVGCGHGLFCLYAALQSPARQVEGIDIDAHKIALATAAAAHLDEGEADVGFETVAPGSMPDGPFDAIVINDVLYLMSAELRRSVLDACVDRLAPEGVFLVKEVDDRPRWKHRVAHFQEVLATRVFRFTEGDALEIVPMSVFADHLRQRGLTVESIRIDRGYLHPHHLLVARHPMP